MGRYSFSGHESFFCKSLWLKKGHDASINGMNFNSPDAVAQLGVGKNMVSSIRFWMRSFGLLNEKGLTKFSHYIFDDNTGKDPYVEDIGTNWLLHYQIVKEGIASIYHLAFLDFKREKKEFGCEQLQAFIKRKCNVPEQKNVYNENTVKKDIGVLLQNYCLPRKPQSNEDFSSLLIDLDLIRQSSEGKGYYFNVDGKRKVTKEIFLYGLLKLKAQEGDNTIAFDTIQENVGLVFCMQDFETIEMLKELSSEYSQYFTYSDVAGIKQVQFTKDLDAFQVLDNYYGKDM